METLSPEAAIFAALASGALAKLVFAAVTYVNRRAAMVKVGVVTQLNCYPIKSCGGFSVDSGLCTPLGLKVKGVTDRHWMVVRSNGDFITQRQLPRMALIHSQIKGTDLVLTAPGMASLVLPVNPKVDREVIMKCRVWQSRLAALDLGEQASKWLSTFLEEPGLRLLFSAPDLPRQDITQKQKPWGNPGLPGDQAAFTDYSSYLVATDDSLNALNERLKDPVTMLSFRPNIVIQGSPAFDEDSWRELQVGDSAVFRMLDPCTRCTLTTVNQSTGVRNENSEPLQTLKSFRCFPKYGISPLFGVNATLDVSAIIRVGDPVYALRK